MWEIPYYLLSRINAPAAIASIAISTSPDGIAILVTFRSPVNTSQTPRTNIPRFLVTFISIISSIQNIDLQKADHHKIDHVWSIS